MTTETAGGETATNEGVLAAINEALGGEHAADTSTTDTGSSGDEGVLEEGGDTSAVESSEEADTGDESGGDETGGDEPEGEGAAAAASADKPAPTYSELVAEAAKLGIQQRHADGRIKSGAEIAAEIAAKQAEGKQGGKSAAKTADPVNDPIDKALGQPTQERIRTLITKTKEAEERATTAQGNFDALVGGLQAANVSPEQYGETVSFLALFNSQDPQQQTQALTILEDMAEKLSTFLGVERRASDPLAKHADLKAEVQQGKLSLARANEIARSRNQQGFRQELTTAVQSQHQQQAAATAALNTARTELNALEASLKASDPNYAAKRASIVPALKEAFKHIPPAQWKATFEAAYKAARVAPKTRQSVPSNQPMRAGKAPAGSGASAASGNTSLNNGGAKSMFEAMWGTPAPK